VFPQALDVPADRVLRHLLSFLQRATVSDTSRQCANQGGESAFWLGSERDAVSVERLGHWSFANFYRADEGQPKTNSGSGLF
jgi:hypothetical protein